MTGFFREPERQAQLVGEARSWLGTRFSHNQAAKGAGVDCVRLVGEVMKSAGVVDGYQFPPYSLDWSQHNERSLLVEYIETTGRFTKIEPAISGAKTGDLAIFKIGLCPHHAGVMLDARQFVHALAGSKVSLGDISDPTWAKRLVAFYRANG